jgi:hypothetical protein
MCQGTAACSLSKACIDLFCTAREANAAYHHPSQSEDLMRFFIVYTLAAGVSIIAFVIYTF